MQCFKHLDNLSGYTNPDFGCGFAYMTPSQSVSLAKSVLSKFVQSGYQNIIVIESGTAPLIEIIKKLPAFKKTNLNIVQLKIPRDLNFNLLAWLRQVLPRSEFEPIKAKLAPLCKRTNLSQCISNNKFNIYDSLLNNFTYDLASLLPFNNLLSSTTLSKLMQNEFLVFDEYINAGTIIRNFNLMAKLFNVNAAYKLSAFAMFVENSKHCKQIAFSLFDKSSELACYAGGAYPFENRIDLINYFYYSSPQTFQKVQLSTLRSKFLPFKNAQTVQGFEGQLNAFIAKHNLVKNVQNACTEPEVAKHINKHDVSRFLLRQLELDINGTSIYHEFLDQAYELFAPAWSPMPVKNHLSYWAAFEALGALDLSALRGNYQSSRNAVMHSILHQFKQNRTQWLMQIKKEIML